MKVAKFHKRSLTPFKEGAKSLWCSSLTLHLTLPSPHCLIRTSPPLDSSRTWFAALTGARTEHIFAAYKSINSTTTTRTRTTHVSSVTKGKKKLKTQTGNNNNNGRNNNTFWMSCSGHIWRQIFVKLMNFWRADRYPMLSRGQRAECSTYFAGRVTSSRVEFSAVLINLLQSLLTGLPPLTVAFPYSALLTSFLCSSYPPTPPLLTPSLLPSHSFLPHYPLCYLFWPVSFNYLPATLRIRNLFTRAYLARLFFCCFALPVGAFGIA